MLGVELEVIAKKVDRFGWDRDRGSLVHDRLVSDWMDTLEDYPLNEVQDACRAWLSKHPQKMPNEQDIKSSILQERKKKVAVRGRPMSDGYVLKNRSTAKERAAFAESLGLAVHYVTRANKGDA